MSNPLKILYDPQMFDLQNYGGISRYFANLIAGINKKNNFIATLPLIYSRNYYVRNMPQLMRNKIVRKLLKDNNKRKNANQYYANLQIRRSNFDIFHATYYNPYFLKYLKKPLVITIHDMIYENYPHLFTDSKEIIQQKKILIEAADLIISISNYTHQQLLKHYPYCRDKIRVVYHGLPEGELLRSNEVLPEKFLLYVGDRNAAYKNFIPLLTAITPILHKEPKIQMICAGGGTFNEEELTYLKKLRIINRVTQMNVTDIQLTQLYQDALLFIYPSLEEGFGLPMLEAFKNGCAIACSYKSCFPEVGGSASAYFNPEITSSIQNTVSELIADDELRNSYINKGYQQLEKFHFENCLKQTMDCYNSLIV